MRRLSRYAPGECGRANHPGRKPRAAPRERATLRIRQEQAHSGSSGAKRRAAPAFGYTDPACGGTARRLPIRRPLGRRRRIALRDSGPAGAAGPGSAVPEAARGRASNEVPRYQPALRKTGRRANPGTCNCGRILGSMRSKKCRPTTRRHALQRAARRIPVRIGPPHGRAVPACRQTGGRGSLQCLPSGLRRSRTGAGSAAIPGNAAHGSSTRMRPRISQSMLWTRGRLDHRLGHRPGGAPDAT